MAAATRSGTGAGTGFSAARHRLHLLLVDPDPVRRGHLQSWLADTCEVHAAPDAAAALALAMDVVPGLLVVDTSAGAVGNLIDRMHEELAVFDIGVLLLMDAAAPGWMADGHPHLRRPFTREQLLAAIARASTPQRAPAAMLRMEQQRREEAEALLALALDLAQLRDPPTLLQRTVDAATRLTGASQGLLVHFDPACRAARSEPHCLCAESGAPSPGTGSTGAATDVDLATLTGETFTAARVVRSDDVRAMPSALPPPFARCGGPAVRSYLAAPIVGHGGLSGGIFLGHPDPARFSLRSERIVTAIAAEAAVALENAWELRRLEQSVAELRRAPGPGGARA